MKSLAALRYAKDSPEVFDLEDRVEAPSSRHGVRSALLSNAVRISPQLFPGLARAVDFSLQRLDPSMKPGWHSPPSITPDRASLRTGRP